MTAATLTQPIATETIKTTFKYLPNGLVKITLEGDISYFENYGKVLSKPHSLGYERIMLDNGEVIYLDMINKTLVDLGVETLEEYNFTEIYKDILVA